ncbi:MAG: amidoligase family protein [Xanthomonadales bacterium]|nr:amidoligase family protein [Xanthomonadales bacterium]
MLDSMATDPLKTPPWTTNADGEIRRVGVEVEFSGLDPESTATLVADQFGGQVERVSEFEFNVTGTSEGEFRIELDMVALKRLGHELEDKKDSLRRSTAELVGRIAGTTVPTEIITPPIRWDRLDDINQLIRQLADSGAEGTQESMLFAFGVHLNPDCPSLESEVLLRIMQAYACLHDWLAKMHEVDLVRRITPFIQPYPVAYQRHILADDYAPSIEDLIADYLEFTPSRNRALDMLPVFCCIDEDQVRAVLPEEKINPRPTFHYRLPNSEVGREHWGIAAAWNGWVTVEQLATNASLLRKVAAARESYLDRILRGSEDWVQYIEDECLNDL